MKLIKKQKNRIQRKRRIRSNITGNAKCPRLSIYRSLNHIYAQLIDDTVSKTILSVSTLSKELKDKLGKTGNVDAARAVGELLAEKALATNIKKVVFDRNGFLYHGRVKALADGARAKGLEF